MSERKPVSQEKMDRISMEMEREDMRQAAEPTPHTLTREQVELLANGLNKDGLSFEQRLAIRSLMENDGNLRQDAARLRGILQAILNADERGQGLPFQEAMQEAQRALKGGR